MHQSWCIKLQTFKCEPNSSLIDFDEIFLKLKMFIFHLKIVFIDKENIWKSEIRYILIEMNQIFPMKPSESKISISVESYDEKTVENYWNVYVVENTIVSKQPKITIPNVHRTNWRLEWRLGQNLTSFSYMLCKK